MSSPSPTSTTGPPARGTINLGELWSFTNLVLMFIFLTLFIRLVFIFISINREQSHEPSSSTQDEENNITKGLTFDVINSYQSFPYRKIKATSNDDSNNYDTSCCICLSDYGDWEILRMMPRCHHYFHRDCVDTWLKVNGSCPICRNSPLQVTAKA